MDTAAFGITQSKIIVLANFLENFSTIFLTDPCHRRSVWYTRILNRGRIQGQIQDILPTIVHLHTGFIRRLIFIKHLATSKFYKYIHKECRFVIVVFSRSWMRKV